MRNWLLRGLAFAAAMVVVRLIQGTIINASPTHAALVSVVLLLLFATGVAVWGVLDGRADATTNPDPDHREDLAMTWLLAGLAAGILSGAVCWLISLLYEGLYTGGFLNEVTTFAAFTALVVFLPGIIGVAIGRWRVDRNPPPHRDGAAEDERADTDVFTAVRADTEGTQAAAGELQAGGAQSQERAAAPTALAEREAPTLSTQEAPTEAFTMPEHEAPTETIAIPEPEAPTEAIPTGPWGRPAETAPGSDDAAKTEVLDLDQTKPETQPKQD